jgi:8-oxo-dGTP pyrophosphatase MutT (NUDIX family)
MRVQKSAGGVICRETEGRIEVALISPRPEVWALPKGIVEKGESADGAALREVLEETGLEGEILDNLGYIEYWYRDPGDKALLHKFVDFFLLRYAGGDLDRHDAEVLSVRWFPIQEAIQQASYESERQMLEKARQAWDKRRAGD